MDYTPETLTLLADRARSASRVLATLPTVTKNDVLRDLADGVLRSQANILDANRLDMEAARASGLADSKLRRLELTPRSLAQLASGLLEVSNLPDPVGVITTTRTVPSGLRIERIRCPLGVIAMIYEARPAVTLDAFALCFKAGNACILKGGKESLHSSRVLAAVGHDALAAHQLPAASLLAIPDLPRAGLEHLLTLSQSIDLVIPRGGTDLVTFVTQHSRIPVIQHYRGVCHIYIDADADVNQVISICVNAKVSAPSACNAAECLLLHKDAAPQVLGPLLVALGAAGVAVRACPRTIASPGIPFTGVDITPADESDFGHEYLSLTIAIKIVDSLDDAVSHIQRYGSNHTEAILTQSPAHADEFVERVHSSCVLVNASTRFNDGFQLGLGAEIGISTSKLHAYGPMGLEELTTQRYIVRGEGHARM
jgi:glutamate-5-semialdehyde dehydrogenase